MTNDATRASREALPATPAKQIDLSAIAKAAAVNVETGKYGIELLSKTIADYMEKLHGGDWKILINHEAKLVAVSPSVVERKEKRIDPSSLREAV